MSKKHKNRGGQPQSVAAPEVKVGVVDTAAPAPAEDEQEPEVKSPEEAAPAAEVTAPAAEVPPPPPPPAKLSAPAPEPLKTAPAATPTKKLAAPMAKPGIAPEKRPARLTAQGIRMTHLLDEYYDLCSKTNDLDLAGLTKCARKLFDIMIMCVPHSTQRNTAFLPELINLLFNALSAGRGTVFHDQKIWRASYNLPSPADCFKFDTFYTVMTQLVEYSINPRRKPMYNQTAVDKVLQSPATSVVFANIRRRLDERNLDD